MQGDKGFDGGFGVLHCAAAAPPVEGCLGLHSDYLQTLLGDRELLFTAHRLSITCIWLKILQSWNRARAGGVGRMASTVSKGTEVTPQ